ncbi:unnamed protein product, partial [Trichogramma brassicae]
MLHFSQPTSGESKEISIAFLCMGTSARRSCESISRCALCPSSNVLLHSRFGSHFGSRYTQYRTERERRGEREDPASVSHQRAAATQRELLCQTYLGRSYRLVRVELNVRTYSACTLKPNAHADEHTYSRNLDSRTNIQKKNKKKTKQSAKLEQSRITLATAAPEPHQHSSARTPCTHSSSMLDEPRLRVRGQKIRYKLHRTRCNCRYSKINNHIGPRCLEQFSINLSNQCILDDDVYATPTRRTVQRHAFYEEVCIIESSSLTFISTMSCCCAAEKKIVRDRCAESIRFRHDAAKYIAKKRARVCTHAILCARAIIFIVLRLSARYKERKKLYKLLSRIYRTDDRLVRDCADLPRISFLRSRVSRPRVHNSVYTVYISNFPFENFPISPLPRTTFKIIIIIALRRQREGSSTKMYSQIFAANLRFVCILGARIKHGIRETIEFTKFSRERQREDMRQTRKRRRPEEQKKERRRVESDNPRPPRRGYLR